MIVHPPSLRQAAASEFDDWIDFDRLAGEVGITLARQVMHYAHHLGLDGQAVLPAETARDLLALVEEVRG